MQEKELAEMNHLYCRVADKWHQMFYGFSSAITACEADTYFMTTHVASNCSYSRKEIFEIVAKGVKTGLRLTEPVHLQVTMYNVENEMKVLLHREQLKDIDNVLDAYNTLTAPIKVLEDTKEVFDAII